MWSLYKASIWIQSPIFRIHPTSNYIECHTHYQLRACCFEFLMTRNIKRKFRSRPCVYGYFWIKNPFFTHVAYSKEIRLSTRCRWYSDSPSTETRLTRCAAIYCRHILFCKRLNTILLHYLLRKCTDSPSTRRRHRFVADLFFGEWRADFPLPSIHIYFAYIPLYICLCDRLRSCLNFF